MEKTKVLLVWNDKKGKHEKYILNLALQQNNPEEEHYLAGQHIGEE